MAEPIWMWSYCQLVEHYELCYRRMCDYYWQDRNKTRQSLEEMALEAFMYSIYDEIRLRDRT